MYLELMHFADDHGYLYSGNNLMGKHKGYPFKGSITNNKNFSADIYYKGTLTSGEIADIRSNLPEKTSIRNHDGKISVSCSDKDEAVLDRFFDAAEIITHMLEKFDAAPADREFSPEETVVKEQSVRSMGKIEYFLFSAEQKKKEHFLNRYNRPQKSKEYIPGSYLTGILGALLGGVIAAIIVYVGIITDVLFSDLLYTLIPVAGAIAYRLFGGKKTNMSLLILFVVSFVIMAAITQVEYYLEIKEQIAFQVTLVRSIPYYFTTHTFASIYFDIALPTIFIFVGSLLGLFIVKRESYN